MTTGIECPIAAELRNKRIAELQAEVTELKRQRDKAISLLAELDSAPNRYNSIGERITHSEIQTEAEQSWREELLLMR